MDSGSDDKGYGKGQDDDDKPRKPEAKEAHESLSSTCSQTSGSSSPTESCTVLSSPISPTQVAEALEAVCEESSTSVERQREILYQRTVFLSILSSLMLLWFLVQLVPVLVLMSIGAFATSSGLLTYSMYRRLELEFNTIVQGRGFGQYLPESVLRELTETNLHEFLSQQASGDWNFLLLYLVPGLSREQREAYIARLTPEHQTILNRRGLGYFLGDSFMRFIVGDSRWQPEVVDSSTSLASYPRRQIAFVANQENGNLQNALPGASLGYVTGVQGSVAPSETDFVYNRGHALEDSAEQGADAEPTTGSVASDSSNTEANAGPEDEIEAVVEALNEGMMNYFNTGMQFANERILDWVLEPALAVVSRVGLWTSTIASSAAFLGYTIRVGPRAFGGGQRSSSSFSSLHFPSERTLLFTALIGGASAGVAVLVRQSLRETITKPSSRVRSKGDENEAKDNS